MDGRRGIGFSNGVNDISKAADDAVQVNIDGDHTEHRRMAQPDGLDRASSVAGLRQDIYHASHFPITLITSK